MGSIASGRTVLGRILRGLLHIVANDVNSRLLSEEFIGLDKQENLIHEKIDPRTCHLVIMRTRCVPSADATCEGRLGGTLSTVDADTSASGFNGISLLYI